MLPTTRSLHALKQRGYQVAFVERRLGNGWRKDAFGFADVLALKPGQRGVLAVQVTTETHWTGHREKLAASALLRLWLQEKNRFELHLWGVRKRGQRRRTWRLRIKTPQDILRLTRTRRRL